MNKENPSDTLTLEKLKIHERLQAMELGQVKILTELKAIGLISDTLKRHNDVLFGNGREGLITTIIRATDLHEAINKHFQEDKESFKMHNERIRAIERLVWSGVGGLAVLQVILKFVHS